MAFEQREGSGALFKNFKKEGKQPDWRFTPHFRQTFSPVREMVAEADAS